MSDIQQILAPISADRGMIERAFDTRDWEAEDYHNASDQYARWVNAIVPPPQLSTLYSNAIARAEKAEEDRAEQWRQRREAEADRDTANAVANSFKIALAQAEEALRDLVYETTHLSPERDDGSHDCRISRNALAKARAALVLPPPPVRETP